MHQYLILLLVWTFVITACSSAKPDIDMLATPLPPTRTNMPSAAAIVKITATRYATRTPTLRPSPSPSPTPLPLPTLGFALPSVCDKVDPSIDPRLYEEYDLAYGACGYPSLSPDGSLLAYVTLIPTTTVEHQAGVVPTVQLYSFTSRRTYPIYQAECVFLKLQWTPTGQLVIFDSPYDVGCGYTAIYEPVQKRTLAVLNGVAFDQGHWADDRSAFFVIRGGGYGPTCDDLLSVFDLSSGKQLEPIKPVTPETKVYAVAGRPIWMPNTNTLLVTLRDGTCSSEADCEYKNSYVIEYTRVGSTFKASYLFYDPAIDYSFHQTDQGVVEFKSAPFKPVDCYDIDSTDGT